MKIGIYSPYLDSVGGGERYILTIAETLAPNHKVEILLDSHLQTLNLNELKDKLTNSLNLDLTNISFTNAPLGVGSNAIERFNFFRPFDYLFALTDGSLFHSSAKKNFLHIQTPLKVQTTKSLWGKVKLSSWNLIIYNSEFTKKNVEKYWPKKSLVIYPPVDVKNIKELKKKNYILTVGRFFGYLKDKKHEVMIKAFKELSEKKELKDWKFHLVGSCQVGDMPYLDELKELAKGLQVEFHPNLSYSELVKLYGESAMYWHASGYGEEEAAKMEHFGITTVEAMAGGAVPVVIGKGGQTEIVQDGVSGYLWESLDQMKAKTLELIKDTKKRNELSENAMARANMFSKEKFEEKIKELVNG